MLRQSKKGKKMTYFSKRENIYKTHYFKIFIIPTIHISELLSLSGHTQYTLKPSDSWLCYQFHIILHPREQESRSSNVCCLVGYKGDIIFIIASYYRQLSADNKKKNHKIKLFLFVCSLKIVRKYRNTRSSVWLRTDSNPLDINRFRSFGIKISYPSPLRD